MKKIFTLLFMLFITKGFAQQSGSFMVRGDFDKFYPVVFVDNGFYQSFATELEIGRSSVHTDSDWRGSFMAKFRFHTTQWGNGSRFMEADIIQSKNVLALNPVNIDFVAGWDDASQANTSTNEIIYLRGGGTTYYFRSNVTVSPTVYDGVQNALPYVEQNNGTHTYKTAKELYVNSNGLSYEGTAMFNGLAINGNIRAREIKVETSNWPDYVFKPTYKLPDLKEVKSYIDQNQHLPEMPSEREVTEQGLNLGDMNKLLTKKVEELTLYLIQLKAENEGQQLKLRQLENKIDHLLIEKGKKE